MVSAIAKLGHVDITTPDLEATVGFFADVVGLQEVERVDGTAYLRGLRDWQHHTLAVREAASGGVDRIGWRARSEGAVDDLADRLETSGTEVARVAADETPGIGESIRFETPTGQPFEVYYDVEKPAAPAEKRSLLKNRVYSSSVANAIAPQRIDHVHVQDPAAADLADWLQSAFEFDVNELYREDGDTWGWWLSVTPLPHDVGVHRIEDGSARFHHVSFHVDTLENLWHAADVCREEGIEIDGGPGRHAITKADFLYVREPASGVRLELFAGPGYLNFEPDWEPIVWEETIGTADDHQWFGTQFSADGSPYNR